jgi:hypothetical protein
VKTYYLDNNGQWFRDIVKLEDVRKWIERTIDEGEDIYVVVGYHTVLDAHIAEQSREQKLLGGSLDLPVSSVLLASGVVGPFSDLTDPRVARPLQTALIHMNIHGYPCQEAGSSLNFGLASFCEPGHEPGLKLMDIRTLIY